jgi:hypothetical protein
MQAFLTAFGLNQILGNVTRRDREQLGYAPAKTILVRQPIKLFAVAYQCQIQVIIRKCDTCKLLGDMAHFGVGGFEKFSPGRQFIKNIPDLDGGAVIGAAWAYTGLGSAIDLNAVSTG